MLLRIWVLSYPLNLVIRQKPLLALLAEKGELMDLLDQMTVYLIFWDLGDDLRVFEVLDEVVGLRVILEHEFKDGGAELVRVFVHELDHHEDEEFLLLILVVGADVFIEVHEFLPGLALASFLVCILSCEALPIRIYAGPLLCIVLLQAELYVACNLILPLDFLDKLLAF